MPQVFFARDGAGAISQLLRMNWDGTGVTTITATDANRLSVSSQSGLTKIFYESLETGNSDVFSANLDGSGAVNLTNNSAEDFDCVVSEDGSTVAFLSNRSGTTRLYVMSSNGTGVTEISALAGMDGLGLALNSDGSRVVFCAAPSGWPQIYTANTSGTITVTNLSNDLNSFDLTPVISPDGTTVVYSKDGDLYRIPIGGGTKTFIYSAAGDIEFPSYSSDGTKIIFLSLVNLAWDVFRVDLNGSNAINLTTTPTDEGKVSGYVGQ